LSISAAGQGERVLEADAGGIASRARRVHQRPGGRIHAVKQPRCPHGRRVEHGLRRGHHGHRIGHDLLLGLEHDPEAPIRQSAPNQLLGGERVGHAGLEGHVASQEEGGKLDSPLLVEVDGDEVGQEGPLCDYGQAPHRVGDDPGSRADAQRDALRAHLGDRAGHVGGGQALPPVSSPNVKVHGTGTGPGCFGRGGAQLGGGHRHRRVIGR
jgi:hypothetical protein